MLVASASNHQNWSQEIKAEHILETWKKKWFHTFQPVWKKHFFQKNKSNERVKKKFNTSSFIKWLNEITALDSQCCLMALDERWKSSLAWATFFLAPLLCGGRLQFSPDCSRQPESLWQQIIWAAVHWPQTVFQSPSGLSGFHCENREKERPRREEEEKRSGEREELRQQVFFRPHHTSSAVKVHLFYANYSQRSLKEHWGFALIIIRNNVGYFPH